jgi:carbon monoxide dehydrogenase subunit G
MATIRKTFDVSVPADRVWDVFRDVGAVHTRLAPGFVVDTRLEAGPAGAARVVTFANGFVVRELIVAMNDELRRLAYAGVGGQLEHHNASFEVVALTNDRSRVVWTTDLLPDSAVAMIGPMIEQGAEVMRETLSRC